MPFALLNNPGFELQSAPATPIDSAIFGWRHTAGGPTMGVYAPGAIFYTAGVPEGSQVGYLDTGVVTIAQYLPYEIVEGATYTLRVKFGWNRVTGLQPTYGVALYAAETASLLANTGSPGAVAPATVYDSFVQAIIPYTADATHVGKTLVIVIQCLGTPQLDFDDVTLEVVDDPTWAGGDVWLDERDLGAGPAIGTWTDYAQPYNSQYVDGTVRGIIDANQQYQWKPTLAAGKYKVRAFIPAAAGTFSSSVDYTIINAGPAGNVNIDQHANKGLWVDLGTYDFNAGNSGYVQSSGGGGIFLVADAVCWHRVTTGADVPVAGVQSATGVGAPTASGGAGADVVGVQAASGIGTPGVDVERNIFAPVDGVNAAGQVGIAVAVVPGAAVTPEISGVQAVPGLGLLEANVAYRVSIQGVSVQAQIGELRMVEGIWIPMPVYPTQWTQTPPNDTSWTKEEPPETVWLPGPAARE